ncbi:hypothetical protein Pfo_018907 [Paulownia fortunei]|nr:hypothetical protein Pfo_018907 [Paulownia fortunei]
MMSLNMESLFNPQSNHGIMDEQLVMVQDFHHDHDVSNSCSSSSTINEEEEEEVNSSSSSSPTSPSSSTPLQDMSSLLLQLPLKRGLSKHYNGKSQSFTSLSNVRCLEDLAKQENPYNKKLKTCKSYGGLPRNHTCSRLIGKKPSNKGSNFSSLIRGRRNSSFFGNNNNNHSSSNNNNNRRPPIPPPHRSTSTSSLFY